MNRRSFLQGMAAIPPSLSAARPAESRSAPPDELPRGHYRPGSIVNAYNTYLPGEKESLSKSPQVVAFDVRTGEFEGPESSDSAGWRVSARLDSEAKSLKLGEEIGG